MIHATHSSPTPRPMPRLAIAALAAIAGVALFAAAYGVADTVMQAVRPAPAPDVFQGLPGEGLVPGAVSNTDRAIGSTQERLRQRPEDTRAQTTLAVLYLQKARETGDPSYYGRADALLQESNARAPEDADTLVGLGSLALSRHTFGHALGWGERAVRANPDKAVGYGVVTDALVELGRYEEAVASLQTMVDIRPDQASYARIAYLRELHGDLPGAERAMRMAVESGRMGSEGTEWSRVQMGHLFFAQGNLDAAEQAYRAALAALPGYVHATGGLARLAAARGDIETAIALYREATQAIPLPEFVAGLADLYRAVDRPAEAAQQIEVVRAMQQLLAANGVNTDIDVALILADHDVDPAGAVALAREEWANRQSIHVADTLGWSLYKTGQCAEADVYAREALRLGTRDPMMLFHAGEIARCVGEPARALSLLEAAVEQNPVFSPTYGPRARQSIRELQASHASR